MNRQDQLSSLVWLFVGLFIIVGSLYSLKVWTASEPGPGLFPLIAGILLSFMSLIILIKGTFTKTLEKKSLRVLWSGLKWKKVFYMTGALLIYSLILDFIGFILSTLLLLIFLFIGIQPQKWKVAIGLSLFTSVGSYLLFYRILQVQLPRGLLGF